MSVCLGSARVCALRVTRLDEYCQFVTGAGNAVVSSAIVRLQSSPEYETGDEFIQKNGCGEVQLVVKTLDKLKRMNLQMELCTRDMELMELLTGGTLYTEGADVTGFARRGVGASDPNPVSLELWTKAIPTGTGGGCPDPNAGAAWWRWVYPKATFTLGDVTHENGIGLIQMTGYAEPNVYWGNGPFNDWPADELLQEDSPEHFVLDSVGPPTSACGLVSVPSGS
jgi:hypothetical protein